jgi:hypothetical protein
MWSEKKGVLWTESSKAQTNKAQAVAPSESKTASLVLACLDVFRLTLNGPASISRPTVTFDSDTQLNQRPRQIH